MYTRIALVLIVGALVSGCEESGVKVLLPGESVAPSAISTPDPDGSEEPSTNNSSITDTGPANTEPTNSGTTNTGTTDTGTTNSGTTETGASDIEQDLDGLLHRALIASGGSVEFFQLPQSDDFDSIPQDPNNPLSDAKVRLGQFLFHDTAFSLNGESNTPGTWSCATCHHAKAGFKSGVLQGIGEGGRGFGHRGSERRLADGLDALVNQDNAFKPDTQDTSTPSILNAAFQDVMLWNGQFGNSVDGIVNAGLPDQILMEPETPMENNQRYLSGVEIQAIAGSGVHRLRLDSDSPLQTNGQYRQLFHDAYEGGSADVLADAGKAIAAFERTVMANRAPFQRWLGGEHSALDIAEKRGALLFFGKARCVECHTGPALSSAPGASEREMFMAIGLNDLNTDLPGLTGEVVERTSLGRGGFTKNPDFNYSFKIPQLYNLSDADVLGHGGSFRGLRELVEYKNRAIPENKAAAPYVDPRFVPLGLSDAELDDLVRFLERGLYDPDLMRYQPESVPGACVVVDPMDHTRPEHCAGLDQSS